MSKNALSVLAFTAALGFSGAAGATLFDRHNGMIYDSGLNITWLWNANYAATELTDVRRDEIIAAVSTANPTPSYLVLPGTTDPYALSASDFYTDSGGNYTGRMSWWGAMAWADQLVYGGYDDWRLPTVTPINGIAFQGFSNSDYWTGGRDLSYNVSAPGTTYAGSTASELAYMYRTFA